MINDHLRYELAKEQREKSLRDEARAKALEQKIQFCGIPIAVLTLVIGVLGIIIQALTTDNERLLGPNLLRFISGAVLIGLVAVILLRREE